MHENSTYQERIETFPDTFPKHIPLINLQEIYFIIMIIARLQTFTIN